MPGTAPRILLVLERTRRSSPDPVEVVLRWGPKLGATAQLDINVVTDTRLTAGQPKLPDR